MSKTPNQFCSLVSAAAGEPLIGSAGTTAVFFLLEYNGAWEDKAFEKSNLPMAVKQMLGDLAKSLPAAKILLIKRNSQPLQGQIHFFVAVTDPQNSRLYQFNLKSYEELLDIQMIDVLQGANNFDAYLQPTPLFLVCTNGRRDLCCARFGIPIYEALKAITGATTWECSHLGGHRFAPNVFIMPYGLLYGRVQQQDLAGLVGQAQAGQMRLENLRGRSAYAPPVQAAEYYLRSQTAEHNLSAYSLVEAFEFMPAHWKVCFKDVAGGKHSLDVFAEQNQEQVYESCMLDKPTQVMRYSLA